MVPRVTLLLAVQKAGLLRVEVPLLPFVIQRLAELSADLCGEVDGHEAVPSGDHGFQKGKLLPKPKARMDAYHVNRSVFSFAT